MPISIDTKDVRRFIYIYWNRVDIVGFEINIDISRETLINKFGNLNCCWVTFTSVIGPIGLVIILIFPQGIYEEKSNVKAKWGQVISKYPWGLAIFHGVIINY